jgi:protein involved in polysaccharide export with SLBB domain
VFRYISKTRSRRWTGGHWRCWAFLWLLGWTLIVAGGATAGAPAGGEEDTYHVAAGDRLGVAITFAPPSTGERQVVEPGDQLGIIPHIDPPDPDRPYRLERGDLLNVVFKYSDTDFSKSEPTPSISSPLNRSYIIQTDGKIRMVGIRPPVQAAGKTTDELTSAVERVYRDAGVLKYPEATVLLESRNDVKHKQLLDLLSLAITLDNSRFRTSGMSANREEITNRSGGSILIMPVANDGRMTLPLIGSVPVIGRSIEEVGKKLTEVYRKAGYDRIGLDLFFVSTADNTYEQLMDLLSDRNNPMRMEVLPSGRIALPMLRSQAVAGKTTDQIGDLLTAAYRQRGLKRVEVSVWVERRAGGPTGEK